MFNIGTVETSASGMISKKASYLASYVATRENGTRFWKKCGGLCVLSFPTPNAGHSQKNTMSDPERFISSESKLPETGRSFRLASAKMLLSAPSAAAAAAAAAAGDGIFLLRCRLRIDSPPKCLISER